jgi:putative transposase
VCDGKNEGLRLSERFWVCATCLVTHDRDINVAVNIRNQGILQLKAAELSVSAHGGGVRPARIVLATAREVGSLTL